MFSVHLSLTAVGLTAAVSNLTPQYLALGNSRGIPQLLGTCLKILFLLMVPISAVVLLCYDPISVYWLGDARTQLGLILLLPCVALTGVENLHKHYFYGTGSIRPPAAVELCEQFIRTGAVLGLLAYFLPQYPERVVGLIVAGMVICEVASAVTLTVLCRWRLRRMGLNGPGEPGRVRRRRVFSIALPVGLNALLGNLMGAVNAALVPQKLVEELGVSEDDLDSISGFPRTIEGVLVGAVIRDSEPGKVKFSVRTAPGFNASTYCAALGGGGHAAAAGASIPGTLAEGKEALLQVLRQDKTLWK